MHCVQSLFRGHRHSDFHRTLFDVASINWVRDRGLDHAVEKEGNLKSLLNLKNLIKSEPSKSLPLSLIAQQRESLGIALRPVDFIRRYPSVFQEFFPGGIGIHPHVKLTPEVLGLDADEHLVYQSEDNKRVGANRLLKLLMLGRINKIPLHVVERLKWDLGLPHDFTETIVPEFPDYFKVTGGNGNGSCSEPYVELVCWSNELAVSVIEKKTRCEKGMPVAFPLQYSTGFEVDKKFKKWVDEWQKLPYVSPYENALHLLAKSDEADKWVVSVLHELLHLLIGKKTDRENVLLLGECLGLRSRFKRAMLQHPGIFYLSSKIGTHTVVLREGFKRNLLIENHPLMNMRYKYIHLMNTVKEDKKTKGLQTQQQKLAQDSTGDGEAMQDGETEKGQDGESCEFSDSEVEEGSEDDYSDDDDEEEEEEEEDEARSQTASHVNARGDRARTTRTPKYEAKRPLRSPNNSEGRNPRKTSIKEPTEEDEARNQTVSHVNARGDRARTRRTLKYESKRPLRSPNSSEGRNPRKTRTKEPAEVCRSTSMHGRQILCGQSPGRSEISRNRWWSNSDRKASVLK